MSPDAWDYSNDWVRLLKDAELDSLVAALSHVATHQRRRGKMMRDGV